MGLDIVCNEKDLHCRYSYIQEIRKNLTIATIKYMESLKFDTQFVPQDIIKNYFIPSPHDINDGEIEYDEQINDFESHKTNMIQFLKETLKPKNNLMLISYELWYNPNPFYKSTINLEEVLSFFGIISLRTLISHSDCEGYFSVGQSVDIMDLFSRINGFLEDMIKDKEDELLFYNELIDLFKESVDTKNYVFFK
jgi:hypothetical protein